MVRRIREEVIEDDVSVRPVVVQRRISSWGMGPNPAAIALIVVLAVVLIVLIASAL